MSYGFIVKNRVPSGDSYTTLADDAPAWLKDAVREAHDDELPGDWRYATCAGLVYQIIEEDLDEDELSDLVDGEVDIYTTRLLDWLRDDVSRKSYIEEAIDTFGIDPLDVGDIDKQIMMGQSLCIEQMARTLWLAINVAHAEYEAECEIAEAESLNLGQWATAGFPEGPSA